MKEGKLRKMENKIRIKSKDGHTNIWLNEKKT